MDKQDGLALPRHKRKGRNKNYGLAGILKHNLEITSLQDVSSLLML